MALTLDILRVQHQGHGCPATGRWPGELLRCPRCRCMEARRQPCDFPLHAAAPVGDEGRLSILRTLDRARLVAAARWLSPVPGLGVTA